MKHTRNLLHVFFVGLTILLVTNTADGYRKNKRHKIMIPAELRGAAEDRVAQNVRSINSGIFQITTDADLAEKIKEQKLVELTSNDNYTIDRGTSSKKKIVRKIRNKKIKIICEAKPNKVFVRPWVKQYAYKLAADYRRELKTKKFKITSGARTLEEQKEMRNISSCYYNRAAALADTPMKESLHVRGIAFDISRKGMNIKEIKWMRERLIKDKFSGVEFEIEDQEEPLTLDAQGIEERTCFHIVVFPKK